MPRRIDFGGWSCRMYIFSQACTFLVFEVYWCEGMVEDNVKDTFTIVNHGETESLARCGRV